MVFSSISFIYVFLPLLLFVYTIAPKGLRNSVLLAFSVIFYFLGEPVYILLLLLSSVVDYSMGRIIERYRGGSPAKIAMASSIIFNIGLLGTFKYSDFFVSNINNIFGSDFNILGLALPLGISFYTFQTMSYTIDVYRGEVKAQKNFMNFAMYVCLFPQLVAGPIVRYQTIADEIDSREYTLDNVSIGIRRFVIGLGKKIMIANSLGELNAILGAVDDKSVLLYWTTTIAFMLQIYFDFSGYSDMAIGLGRMLGFNFLENFNYPFIAKSISEFWTRWHISLGSFIRDYVYIPLGGNRVSKLGFIRNIIIVWFLTGFWHGADWNFILWGLYFAVWLVLEKILLGRLLEKSNVIIRYIYMFIVLVISFAIFETTDLSLLLEKLKALTFMSDLPLTNEYSIYYLRSYVGVFIVGIIGATPLMKNLCLKVDNSRFKGVMTILEPITLGVILIICTAYIIDSSFNPFLYFRF